MSFVTEESDMTLDCSLISNMEDSLEDPDVSNQSISDKALEMSEIPATPNLQTFHFDPEMFDREDESTEEAKREIKNVFSFLDRKNLKTTYSALMKELDIPSNYDNINSVQGINSITDTVLSTFEAQADKYSSRYSNLCQFINRSLETHRFELSRFLYPIFVHFYIYLIQEGNIQAAKSFFKQHYLSLDDFYRDDLRHLLSISQVEHLETSQYTLNFQREKFSIRISSQTEQLLMRYLHSETANPILNTLSNNVSIDLYDGPPRNVHDVSKHTGALMGETAPSVNRSKVLYGVPTDQNFLEFLEQEANEAEKKKKHKLLQNLSPHKKNKQVSIPNSPQPTRIPVPIKQEREIQSKEPLFRAWLQQAHLSATELPCICFYSFLNCYENVISISINPPGSLICVGFSDSKIRIWALTPLKLRSLKAPDLLADLPQTNEDCTFDQIIDESSTKEVQVLLGHTGPVFSTCFSPDSSLLISASEDGTVRLWSLHTFTQLVCYRGHVFPVWSVEFSPLGFYFASSSHDTTLRIWSTDQILPVRVLAGHYSDVDVCKFHPNGNYIASGSSDRTVRLWDVLDGKCVRIFTGHKGTVHTLAFSTDGKCLASAGRDNRVLVWDIPSGGMMVELKGHAGCVYSLAFSRDDNILASGGMDNCVKLWDMRLILNSSDSDRASYKFVIKSFYTKSSAINMLSFNFSNVLIAAGIYTN
ncbi:Transcription initiation factor TFIID subunit 5-like isoform X1 [Oopsacas minuta]|uniref:Transcription initiation factor TFIID subunit 5-like isoform X1 n=1 Tax=Oopsacas minuta TaxID=111878 RepID=A0AAV7K659_9METZ|nr:Transcription initiation factor TFIID subunit 5-like isoform X1 [Oopsacas minuta]